MRTRSSIALAAALAVALSSAPALGQSDDRQVELGGHGTAVDDRRPDRAEPGEGLAHRELGRRPGALDHALREVLADAEPSDVIEGGGSRQVFFDPKPDSPSYLLPVLIVTKDLGGREVEYYSFTQFKVPAGTTDADWNPAKLGK